MNVLTVLISDIQLIGHKSSVFSLPTKAQYNVLAFLGYRARS